MPSIIRFLLWSLFFVCSKKRDAEGCATDTAQKTAYIAAHVLALSGGGGTPARGRKARQRRNHGAKCLVGGYFFCFSRTCLVGLLLGAI